MLWHGSSYLKHRVIMFPRRKHSWVWPFRLRWRFKKMQLLQPVAKNEQSFLSQRKRYQHGCIFLLHPPIYQHWLQLYQDVLIQLDFIHSKMSHRYYPLQSLVLNRSGKIELSRESSVFKCRMGILNCTLH